MNVFSVFIVRSGFPAVTTFRRYEYQFRGKMDVSTGTGSTPEDMKSTLAGHLRKNNKKSLRSIM